MGLGFGAKMGGAVSHCFPLNGDARNPYCRGVEGLVNSYMDCLNKGIARWLFEVLNVVSQ